jgi:hypothetical protein
MRAEVSKFYLYRFAFSMSLPLISILDGDVAMYTHQCQQFVYAFIKLEYFLWSVNTILNILIFILHGFLHHFN